VDAEVLSDEQHRGGRRNRVVLAPQRLALKSKAKLTGFVNGDGGNRQGSPRRARY